MVSDPTAKESGAALVVKAGSWDEPEDSPGLAHFLEHMLFLGTKRYPVESEYDSFLSSHGGKNNAFTYNDITAYLFSVQNEGFDEALDRFSSFFTEPLFNPSGVGREVKAINQEFEMNSGTDQFLRYQVLKELADPKHPFSRFNSGNAVSLQNASQDELKKWFETHYSADKMRLWVFSNLPLEQMETLVEKDFEAIPRRPAPASPQEGAIYSDEVLGKLILLEPLQDQMSLALIWELPSEYSLWQDEKPWGVLCSILGEEGETSLLAELKQEELAQELSCGEIKLSSTKQLFAIEVELTEKGLQNKETVIERIFQAIAQVRKKGIPPELFDQMVALQKLKYQWMPPKEVFEEAMTHSFDLSYEKIETYPENTYLTKSFSPEKVQLLLERLVPDKALYFLTVPSKKLGLEYTQKEKWTGVNYLIAPLDTSRYREVTPIPEIDLPKANLFLPASFKLKSESPLEEWKGIPFPETLVMQRGAALLSSG